MKRAAHPSNSGPSPLSSDQQDKKNSHLPYSNGGGTLPQNNGTSPSPFNESIASSLSANSEQFSTMSASEASSIVEHHIAAHPIRSENDFHYIAELLKNYENEDDLKRIAELLKATDPQFQQQQQQQLKKPPPPPQPSLHQTAHEGENGKGTRKKKERKHKKHKKGYKAPAVIPEEKEEEEYSDLEDHDSSSDRSSDDDSSVSSSGSSSSGSSNSDRFEDDYSSSSSSTAKRKRKRKEKKRKRKEKERRKRERKRERERQRKKDLKKERKRLKKEKKRLKKERKLHQQQSGEDDAMPTQMIEVAALEDDKQWDDEDIRVVRQETSDKDNQRGSSGEQPEQSAADDQENASHQIQLQEEDKEVEPPEKVPTQSAFPYPGMLAPSSITSKEENKVNNSALKADSEALNADDGPTEVFKDEEEPSTDANEEPYFPYPGMLQNNKRPSKKPSTEFYLEDTSLQDFSGNDLSRSRFSSEGLPSLPENNYSIMNASESLPPLTKTYSREKMESCEDSWAQPEGSSWQSDPAYGIQRKSSGGLVPSLPTIYSSTTGQGPSLDEDSSSSQPQENITVLPKQQMGAPEIKSSSEESSFDSNDIPDDEKELEELAKWFSTQEELPVPDDSREKGEYNGETFSRQEFTPVTPQALPLPKSKLKDASLMFERQPSNPVLNKTLELSKKSLGGVISGLSASVLRPPSSRRLDSGVVSTQNFEAMKDAMRASGLTYHSTPSHDDGDATHQSPLAISESQALYTPNVVPDVAHRDTTSGDEMIQAEFAVKPRLLCLHGWRSNAEITRLQLENLGLLDFFDPVFIEGPHVNDKPADDAVSLLSQGPYYSWLEKAKTFQEDTDDDGNEEISSSFMLHSSTVSNPSLKKGRSLRKSIYNFTHGRSGGMNENSRNRNDDPETEELLMSLKAVLMHLMTESRYLDAFSQEDDEIANIPCYDAVYGFSQGAMLVTLLSYEFVRNQVLEEMNLPPMNRMPWKFVISACAANTSMKELLVNHFQMDFEVKLPLPSVHLVGLSDMRKSQSEAIMKDHYNPQQVFPIYLDSGHGIPAATRKLTYILDEIINWFLLKIALPDLDIAHVPVELESDNVSMLHIMNSVNKIQQEHLEEFPTMAPTLDVGKLHLGTYGQYIINTIYSSHVNLIEMLEAADPKDIAFLAPEAKPLTYGKMLDLIRGDGDLRRVGARTGFTVAYVAPFGVVSATAFIVVASQCPAAPLDPAYNEADYLLAFEQLKPDLVITFDGVDSGLVHRVALGQGLRVAHATVKPETCGLFTLKSVNMESTPDLELSVPLVNHADNNGLILRTSGTTSKPKVVPLKLWAIVANSLVIAKNLGLRKTDIALNAMPLFHIGGLSANLLSSLAAGASVILLPQFNAADFFDYLTSPEEPRPTWYSAVPTMHAAIHQFSEDSIFKTSLRFIRSGAAAMPMDLAMKMEETFGCPLILTYSMTEQMPISQPPTGYSIPTHKPNSVGQPVCVSMCIVDKNLRPVPYFTVDEDEENSSGTVPINGEVCISGPMVVDGYVKNPKANAGSFFRMGGMDWFRTGDMGHIDKEGFLFLTGRSKELIKRGGDQVSPYEVEDAIYAHDDVKTAVVFAIPDPIWGERVGAAIVLKDEIKHEQLAFQKELGNFLRKSGLQPFKVPDQVVLVKEDDLPKTRSNKYIRIGLAKALGLNSDKARDDLKGMRPVHYHEAAVGVKFFLAWAVTYVHIGNFDDRSLSEYSHDVKTPYGWEHTRSWCWHNPIFFLVGGFLLAAGTHVPVTKWKDLMNFYSLRIAGLHPMYLLSILFCTANYVARCQPSNYITDFDRLREPLEGEYFVCQSTPIEWSYYPTLFISILSYACTFQSWPFMMPFAWFLSYYTWFSSVYIFCIFVFPWIHQQYHHVRDDVGAIWKLNFFWLAMNYLYVGGIASLFGMDDDTLKNYFSISTYLFPPGWVPCCALGVGCYFLFRHHRPNEKANAWIWGALTDTISVSLLAGWLVYGLLPERSIPPWAGDSLVKRHWDPFLSRILSPIGFLWFWGLAVGTGYTSSLFSLPFVVEWLAPASYNMFLFHQPVSEWYYLVTRGEWWAFPKTFFWFSPYPYPVRFWEFFIVTGIVISFSVFMEAYANEWMVANFAAGLNWLTGGGMRRTSKEGESAFQVVQSIIHELTYADVEMDTGLTEAGLSSMTTIILVSEIKKVYKSLKLTVRDVINSETVGELVDVIEGRMKETANRPELALGKRTAVVAPKTLKAYMGESGTVDDSKAQAGGSGKVPASDASKPGERRQSMRIDLLSGHPHQSMRSLSSQASQSRRSSLTSRRSSMKGAGFTVDNGFDEPRGRRLSMQYSIDQPPAPRGSTASRQASSRMPFTIPTPPANRRSTGMATVSTRNFARRHSSEKRQSSRISHARHSAGDMNPLE